METVQDVLARAAAKGLLGGMIPEQSKAAKKGKSKKNRVASASSKPSSSSSLEREMGGELPNGRDPFTPSGDEEEKGEGDGGEDEEEEKVGETEKEGEKKRRGHKGRKQKGHPKQSNNTTVSTHEPKGHKKKQTKKKGNQSHHKRRRTKSKPRRIPRLTLALMSSAKPSNHLSPITALAQRMSINPAFKSQQTLLSTPSPAGKHPSTALPAIPAPRTASTGLNTQPERAQETLNDAAKPAKAAVRADNVGLPPISSTSSTSLRSRRGSSGYRPLSGTLNSQQGNMSTSSSSISLPDV